MRVFLGVLILMAVLPYLIAASWPFLLASASTVLILVTIYLLAHYLLSRYFSGLAGFLGAVLLVIPWISVYLLGMGGGLIWGHGEGQLGALFFLGFSLLLAGIRADPGCEMMSIPNVIFRKKSRSACLFFSPIDRFEQKKRTR